MGSFQLELLLKKKLEPLSGSSALLAVSGGLDSMVLLHSLLSLRKSLDLNIIVAFVHHGLVSDGLNGESENSTDKTIGFQTENFRLDSYRLVRAVCEKNKLVLYSNYLGDYAGENEFSRHPKTELKSEQELRNFRYEILNEMLEYCPRGTKIFTAHHLDDLLETQMIRLIRGVGQNGLQSMKFLSKNYCRPLLTFNRKEIVDYAERKKIKWMKDPSNSKSIYFRNWLRNSWLPLLEARQPGSVSRMSKSLQTLSENLDPGTFDHHLSSMGISVQGLLSLPQAAQRCLIARYMNKIGIKNYSNNHINELLKHLDTSKKNHNFSLLKCDWTIGPRHIWAERRN